MRPTFGLHLLFSVLVLCFAVPDLTSEFGSTFSPTRQAGLLQVLWASSFSTLSFFTNLNDSAMLRRFISGDHGEKESQREKAKR